MLKIIIKLNITLFLLISLFAVASQASNCLEKQIAHLNNERLEKLFKKMETDNGTLESKRPKNRHTLRSNLSVYYSHVFKLNSVIPDIGIIDLTECNGLSGHLHFTGGDFNTAKKQTKKQITLLWSDQPIFSKDPKPYFEKLIWSE